VASASPTHDSAATFGPAGKFVAVGATTIGPSYAVLLPDGRVFLTDGSAVQIFDPATNKFGKAGKLDAPHIRGSVTGLPDGTVLIAGGMDTVTGDGLATALVYDPKTGRTENLGLGTPNEGLNTGAYDRKFNRIYGLTDMRAHFVYYDVATRRTVDKGRVNNGESVCRTLGIDDEGCLRLGLAPYSTVEDVDRAVSALAELLAERHVVNDLEEPSQKVARAELVALAGNEDRVPVHTQADLSACCLHR